MPDALRDQVLTLCRLHREGLPVKAALEQAIAGLQAVDSPVNSSPHQTALDDLARRVEALEQLTALLTPSGEPVNTSANRSVNSKALSVNSPVNRKSDSVNSSGDWLTVEEAHQLAAERGCPASLATFRRWSRGNAKYPQGDVASLKQWGFDRDMTRLASGSSKNPARFLRAIAD